MLLFIFQSELITHMHHFTYFITNYYIIKIQIPHLKFKFSKLYYIDLLFILLSLYILTSNININKMNIKNLQLAILATIALTFTACGNKTEKETSFDEPTTEMETSSFDTEEITDGPTDEISEEKEEVVSTPKGNNNIDEYLKSYEEYVDQYIKLMKKAKDGDVSAMTEYAEYMEKATDLSEKMEKAESEMSSAQMAKFLKIQAKLTQAASSMY